MIDKNFDFKVVTWKNLGRDELHAIVRLRLNVFVLEQECAYEDLDTKDLKSTQVFAIKKGDDISVGDSVSACLRICAPGVVYVEPSIGRVATRSDFRKMGLGIEIMKRAIKVCESTYPGQGIRISAQLYLEKFYSNLGFISSGETYLEDKIPHIQMFRPSAS
jgi:ElaA protein